MQHTIIGFNEGDSVFQTRWAQVEDELAKWQCNKYTHITRAVPISTDQRSASIIKLETIFSRPAQDLMQ